MKCKIMLKWKLMKKSVTFQELEKSNEVANYYTLISAQETSRQTNQQSNLLNLTVSCEKKS